MAKAPEKVPRRMKRFYREAHEEKQAIEQEYGDYNEPTSRFERHKPTYDDEYSGSLESAFEKVDTLPAGQEKKTLGGLPSMDYEDLNLDEKNEKELKKIGESEMEEKLSLFEIERFKKENKRLPNKDEEGMLAENVFEQMKQEKEISEQSRGSRRRGRDRRATAEKSSMSEDMSMPGMNIDEKPRRGKRRGKEAAPEPIGGGDIGEMGDFKDLLGDEPGEKKTKKSVGDDMDMGLGDLDDMDGDLEEMEDFDLDLNGKKKKKKSE